MVASTHRQAGARDSAIDQRDLRRRSATSRPRSAGRRAARPRRPSRARDGSLRPPARPAPARPRRSRPAARAPPRTTPSPGACTASSIFIASSTTTRLPAATSSPACRVDPEHGARHRRGQRAARPARWPTRCHVVVRPPARSASRRNSAMPRRPRAPREAAVRALPYSAPDGSPRPRAASGATPSGSTGASSGRHSSATKSVPASPARNARVLAAPSAGSAGSSSRPARASRRAPRAAAPRTRRGPRRGRSPSRAAGRTAARPRRPAGSRRRRARRARRQVEARASVPAAGQEAVRRILGVQPRLDRVPARAARPPGRAPAASPPAISSCAADEVDARHHLGDRVLDLQPRVHLEEVRARRRRVEQELDGAGARVAGGRADGAAPPRPARARSSGSTRRERAPPRSPSGGGAAASSRARPGGRRCPWASPSTCTSTWRAPSS